MDNSDDSSKPGPDASSLRAVDEGDIRDDAQVLANLRVTYSTTEISDYVKVGEGEEGGILELAEPLLAPTIGASETEDLEEKLADALSKIELDDITSHFTAAVAEYSSTVFTDRNLSDSIDLEKAAELLDEIDDSGELRLGQIHQASIEELPQWTELGDEAERNPDIDVDNEVDNQ